MTGIDRTHKAQQTQKMQAKQDSLYAKQLNKKPKMILNFNKFKNVEDKIDSLQKELKNINNTLGMDEELLDLKKTQAETELELLKTELKNIKQEIEKEINTKEPKFTSE